MSRRPIRPEDATDFTVSVWCDREPRWYCPGLWGSNCTVGMLSASGYAFTKARAYRKAERAGRRWIADRDRRRAAEVTRVSP